MKSRKITYFKHFSLFFAIAVLLFIAGCTGSPPTAPNIGQIAYNTDTGIDYDTIQKAIDAAGDGETIIVYSGIYEEKIKFNNKNITVRSTDPSDSTIVASTVIDGGGSGTVVQFVSGDESTLEGFTIRNGNSGGYGGGIFILSSDPTITSNTISYNHAGIGDGGGILVWENSNLQPDDFRPAGWGTGRQNIPTGATLDPAEGEEYTIAGNEFLGNEHGTSLDYTEGAHVYFN